MLNNKDYSKESDLQKNVRELEGEVHILSLREKEFQQALQSKDQELKALSKRKQVTEKGTQTDAVMDYREAKSSPLRPARYQSASSISLMN